MKCVQIKNITADVEDGIVEVVDHSIIGMTEDNEKKSASIFNILTSEDENADPVVIKTEYQYSDDDDSEYVNESPILLSNMKDEIKDTAYNIINSIDNNNVWYSDLIPSFWSDDDAIVGIDCWNTSTDKKTHHLTVKMPYATYIFLAKIKSDMITHIVVDVQYTYTDNKEYPYSAITEWHYCGSEIVKEDNGADDNNTRVISMYDCEDSSNSKFGLLVPVRVDNSVKVELKDSDKLSIEEFVKDRENVLNFDYRSFLYYEYLTKDGKIDLIPAFINHNIDNDTWMIYKISESLLKEIFSGFNRFTDQEEEVADESNGDSED